MTRSQKILNISFLIAAALATVSFIYSWVVGDQIHPVFAILWVLIAVAKNSTISNTQKTVRFYQDQATQIRDVLANRKPRS